MSNDQHQDGPSRRDYRGIFPGIFTMGNLVCGFIAVISISEGDVVDGCWFIILAAFLDLLDGKIERLLTVFGDRLVGMFGELFHWQKSSVDA